MPQGKSTCRRCCAAPGGTNRRAMVSKKLWRSVSNGGRNQGKALDEARAVEPEG